MDPEEEGGTMGMFGVVIIAMVGMLLLIAVLWKIFFISNDFAAVQACRDSVQMNAASGLRGTDMLDSIRCPMKKKTIKTGNEAEIKQELADEMAECWYKYGEGRLNLFRDTPGDELTYCAVCSKIDFEGDAKDKKIDDFTLYLLNNQVPAKYLKTEIDSTKTYFNYLKSYDVSQEQIDNIMDDYGSLDSEYRMIELNAPYATMYIHRKATERRTGEGAEAGGSEGAKLGMKAAKVVGVASVVLDVATIAVFIISPDPATKAALAAMGVKQAIKLTAKLTAKIAAKRAIKRAVVVGTGVTAAGAGAGTVAGSQMTDVDWEAYTALIPYDSDSFKSLDCDILPAEQDNFIKEEERFYQEVLGPTPTPGGS